MLNSFCPLFWLDPQLDIKDVSQSYQDSQINHKDVLHLSYQKQGNASILMRDYQDFAIETPVFQYNETCWNFTLRMSARVCTIAYPDILGSSPQVYFGIKETGATIASCYNYSEGYDTSLYLKHQQVRPDIRHTNYFYCEFNSDENHQIGEKININRKQLIVVYKQIILENDGIYIYYRLSDIEPYIILERMNPLVSGLAISGTVLSTKKELLKIHFSIDDTQEKSTAYWFNYRPITGNVMHTMPQIGTTVMFEFKNSEDDSGVATHIIHKNADNVKDMTEPHDRYYTTEFSKRMAMTPKTLYFNNQQENMLLLGNNSGITITTNTEVDMYALGDLTINAKGRITLSAPEQIYLNKSNKESVIDMSMSEIHIESSDSMIYSDNSGDEKPYPNAKEQTITVGAALAGIVEGTVPIVGKIN